MILNKAILRSLMQTLHADCVASISELKRNPTRLISESHGKPIVILNHNSATAYLIPAETYEHMLELIDDKALERIVTKRLAENFTPIKVNMDDL